MNNQHTPETNASDSNWNAETLQFIKRKINNHSGIQYFQEELSTNSAFAEFVLEYLEEFEYTPELSCGENTQGNLIEEVGEIMGVLLERIQIVSRSLKFLRKMQTSHDSLAPHHVSDTGDSMLIVERQVQEKIAHEILRVRKLDIKIADTFRSLVAAHAKYLSEKKREKI